MKKVFIASSSEALNYATSAKELLEETDAGKEPISATVWKDANWELSVSVLASLEKFKNSYDKAVFIFHPDDELNFRNQELKAVRDNVIFEFGLFGGALGFENCFAIVPKNVKIKNPSDLLGIVHASYSLEQNRDESDQLRPAIKKIKQSIRKSIKSKNDYLFRGDYRKAVVDYAIHTSIVDFNLYERWVNSIKRGAQVREDLLYWDRETANKWLKYEDLMNQNINHIHDLASKIRPLCQNSVDIISLGPGSAQKDKIILKEINTNGNVNWYYPIDISSHLLNNALQVITKHFDDRDLKVKGLRANFDSLENLKFVYQYNNSPNIFLLMGNTLGNYNEFSLLRNITNAMLPGDYLILEVNKNIGEQNNLKNQENDLLKEFIIQPLVSLGIKANIDQLSFEVNEGQSSEVDNALRFGANYYPNRDEKDQIGSNTDKITITFSTLYELKSLEKFLSERIGLSIIEGIEYSNQLGFILRKVDN